MKAEDWMCVHKNLMMKRKKNQYQKKLEREKAGQAEFQSVNICLLFNFFSMSLKTTN